MMILRSITRWPGRAAVTLFGVAAAVAVLVASFFTFDAMDLMTDELFTRANRQHVTLVLSQAQPDRVVQDALALPGVRLAEGAFSLPVRVSHAGQSRLVSLQARAPEAQLQRVLDQSGRAITLPDQGLVIPQGLADVLGLEPGASATVELLAPPREVWTLPVAAVIRQTFGQDVQMAQAALFARMRSPPQVNQLHLLVDLDALPALHARVKQTPAIAGITVWTDVRAQFDATISESLLTMTLIYSGLGILITVGVVYNAARIQLSERSHELASLRVLGFSRAEVGYVLVGELMLLTMLAVPLGWVLGYGFAALMAAGFSTDLVTMPFAITPRTYAWAGVLAVGSALVSALLVRRRLDRVEIASALKQKE
jgi:putative ABC transport system permease protein